MKKSYSDGKQYVGNFKDGDFNGQGTMTTPDGSKQQGEWEYGKFIG